MVTVYTLPTCGKCKVLKEKLNAANVVFEEIDNVDIMASRGIQTTPILEVDGTYLNFSDAIKWIQEVYN